MILSWEKTWNVNVCYRIESSDLSQCLRRAETPVVWDHCFCVPSSSGALGFPGDTPQRETRWVDASLSLSGLGDLPWVGAGCDEAQLVQHRWAEITNGLGPPPSCRQWWGAGLAPPRAGQHLGWAAVGFLWPVGQRCVRLVLVSVSSKVGLFFFFFLGYWSCSCPCGWVSVRLLCAVGTLWMPVWEWAVPWRGKSPLLKGFQVLILL